MVIAMQIAAVGILFDQPILIVGAMVVGPEFGPLAGLSVAIVHRQGKLVRRSLGALAVGFPVGVALTLVTVVIFKETGLGPATYTAGDHNLTGFISHPDFFSFFVAFVAGVAGVLSLTSAKSGALVGVLVSVTTIPAASNIAVAATYGDWNEARGAAEQLAINLTSIVIAGVITLFIQRRYLRRPPPQAPVRSDAVGGRAAGRAQPPRAASLTRLRARPRSRSWCARARSPRS